MKSLRDTYRLCNGTEIPCLGFGTFKMNIPDITISAVKYALAAGYRHIDTAENYYNEEYVGTAIKESGVPRSHIFITSKLIPDTHGYDATKKHFEDTLKKMDLSYLDMFLIHWPYPAKSKNLWKELNNGAWKALEEYYDDGRIRAIGISNFRVHHIEALMESAKIAPMVNQIRLCPGDRQDLLVKYCRDRSMLLEAYSPLARGRVFDEPLLKALSEKYGKSIAQVSIRWSLQMGFLPLPKSVTKIRIEENTDVFNFELSNEDFKAISQLEGCCGYSRDPDNE